MSLSYPITSAQNLGLGAVGGGTEAPARVRALGLVAADIGTATPTAAQYSASIWLGASSAPSGLTGQTPGSWFWDTTTPGDIYVTDASGVPQPFVSNGAVSPSAPINFPQGVALTFATNKDSLSRDATDFTWTHTTGDLIIDNTDVNDQIILRVGTDTTATGIELRNNSDVACWAFNPISASAGRLIGLDDCTIVWGTGSDLTISHNGTDSLIANVTGDLKITNTVATKGFVFKGGTATSATYFKVTDSADQVQFSVDNAGAATIDTSLSVPLISVSSGNLTLQDSSATGFIVGKGGTATSATGVKFTDSADEVQFQVLNDGSASLPTGALTSIGLVNNGTMISGVRAVQNIDDNGTIALPTTGMNAIVATSSAANKTGVILTAGSTTGQTIRLINTSANSLTFAAAGTSNVADGTGSVLAALTAMTLTWESGAGRWFRG